MGGTVSSLVIDNEHLISRLYSTFCNFFTSLLYRMYVNCTGPGFSLHSDIVMPYISRYGSKSQIQKYIPQMAAGKCIGAIAMTEPGAGRYVVQIWSGTSCD